MMLGLIFLCTVATITDGDTLRCTDGTRVRLAAIDAPELGACRGRRGRVCVPGNPIQARAALVRLAAGVLRCRRVGVSYGRVVARCQNAGGQDLSCEMIRSGFAAWQPQYDRARSLENCQFRGIR